MRVDLQGNPAGVLDTEHVAHAAQQLADAKACVAEKRKAEAAAKKAQQKQRSRKPANKNAKHFNKPSLSAVDFSQISVGSVVKVKAGDHAKKATVVEVLKDSARVEFENGLVMSVAADRLFA